MTQPDNNMHTGVPRQARIQAEHPVLSITGLVDQLVELSPDDISTLPHIPFGQPLATDDKCQVPTNRWSGVRIADVLNLAGLQADARFVLISGGPFGTPLALDRLDHVLLCDTLDDAPIDVEHGGPWRLVVGDQRFCASVKWVDSMLVTHDEPDNSGQRIVAARRRAAENRA